MSDDDLVPYDLTGKPKYYVEWPAGLPHDPVWNLIPRHRQATPWECSWHGPVDGDRCGACHAEHAEYLETGTWEPRFNSYEAARAAADAEMGAFAADLPRRMREVEGQVNAAFAGLLPEGMRFEWGPPLKAGTLTPEGVRTAMDDPWSPRSPAPFTRDGFEVSETIAVDFFPGAFEALLEALRPRCGALLFPLPPRAPRPVEPVHPLEAPYFAPVQGPQPAACALDEGHRIGWHWCDGTWWKA